MSESPGDQYGLILTRQKVYIDLTTPIMLFETRRSFTLLEWSTQHDRYIPWVFFSGRNFAKLNKHTNTTNAHKRVFAINKKDVPMLAMNKFFKDFEAIKEWLGDYFILFVDDLLLGDK